MTTYSYALPTLDGWIGILCSDAALTHNLYESYTPCRTEHEAERFVAAEWRDAVELVAVAASGEETRDA